jgi:hypothetical protein
MQDGSFTSFGGKGVFVSRWGLLAAVMLGVARAAIAVEPASRDGLVREMTQAMGLETILDSTRHQTEDAYARQFESIVVQLRESGLPPEGEAEVRALMKEALTKISRSWDTAEATRIYANELAEGMSDQDLKDAIAFYTSDEGKRTHAAISAASTAMSTYVSQQIMAAAPSVMQEIGSRMREIAQKHPPKQAEPR